jgi:cellulose biosynthesis protein BcsQ
MQTSTDFNRLLTKDKKVVAFVGTTKNGTSFVVNHVAELLASMGISVAVLDMTKSRNAYYIYTKNEETLRQRATNSIYKLKSGVVEGIKVNRNLTVYTDMPGEEKDYSDAEAILTTLIDNYSLILIDCDFSTELGYFENAQEIFLVQSMDVLTIQPLTAFLRNLKSKNLLRQEKIKIVVNKEQRMKNLPVKVLIGGMAYYNDPSMSFMTELFDKDRVPYCTLPFEQQTYVKYLEGLVDCEISIKGYSKNFTESLRELVNMVYPLINRQTYSPIGGGQDAFSSQTNDTLKKMKRKF